MAMAAMALKKLGWIKEGNLWDHWILRLDSITITTEEERSSFQKSYGALANNALRYVEIHRFFNRGER